MFRVSVNVGLKAEHGGNENEKQELEDKTISLTGGKVRPSMRHEMKSCNPVKRSQELATIRYASLHHQGFHNSSLTSFAHKSSRE